MIGPEELYAALLERWNERDSAGFEEHSPRNHLTPQVTLLENRDSEVAPEIVA